MGLQFGVGTSPHAPSFRLRPCRLLYFLYPADRDVNVTAQGAGEVRFQRGGWRRRLRPHQVHGYVVPGHVQFHDFQRGLVPEPLLNLSAYGSLIPGVVDSHAMSTEIPSSTVKRIR